MRAANVTLKVVTWTGGSSTNANTAYTHSQVAGDDGIHGTNYLKDNADDEMNGNLLVRTSEEIVKVVIDNNSGINKDAALDILEEWGGVGDGVFGAANNYGFRFIYDGGDNNLHIKSGNQAAVNTRLTIERDTGNVGIGTIPAAKLDVV